MFRAKRLLTSLFFVVAVTGVAFGQSTPADTSWAAKHLRVNGYVKHLSSVSFIDDPGDLITHNFIHNRFNFRYYATDKITAAVELRNRFFYGETVRWTPGFGDALEVDPGLADASWSWYNGTAAVGHTMIDRVWFDYNTDKWALRLGRQRINWGMTLLWNSNDLFNVYNFVDFDYEERPGTDGVRFQYFTSPMSRIEVAFSSGPNDDDEVAAVMYRFNKKGYDYQLLGGYFQGDAAIGGGWAGNIKNSGFKGEATYFHPTDQMTDTTGVLNATAAFDFSFQKGTYLTTAILLNTRGETESFGDPTGIFLQPLSPKNLMPSLFSTFVQAAHPINPVWNVSGAVIYLPGVNAMFVMPTVGVTISEAWDLSVVGQSFLGENSGTFEPMGNSLFARLKWSY